MSSLQALKRTRCPDLPPDLLHEVSCRIHDAADFVRFHAVCKAWHKSHQLATGKNTTDQFMPWLLGPNKNNVNSLGFRCIFSKSNFLMQPPIFCAGKNWVVSADGTAVRYFTAADSTLTDPLTGDVTNLPLFLDGHWEDDNPSGISYSDGTVILYGKYSKCHVEMAEFRVALLYPGGDEWTVVDKTIGPLYCQYYGDFCAAYHPCKILVTIERNIWQVMTTTRTLRDDVPVVTMSSSLPLKRDGYYYEHGHLLISCGELLLASVHLRTDFWKEYQKGTRNFAGALYVSVHVLEEDRWVLKNGISLTNVVFFLGWPNSFSVDASRLDIKGGFAYFMHTENKSAVYRYNLVEDKTEFIDWIPQGWHHRMCTWLIPQPTIAPIHLGRATTPRSNKPIT